MKMNKIFLGVISLLAVFGLPACGGGSGGGDTDNNSNGSNVLSVSLNGDAQMDVGYETLWDDPGVSLNGDGSQTASVEIIGDVNTAQAGTYTITYQVTPATGDVITAEGLVTVN